MRFFLGFSGDFLDFSGEVLGVFLIGSLGCS